jgi:hypothetical protein
MLPTRMHVMASSPYGRIWVRRLSSWLAYAADYFVSAQDDDRHRRYVRREAAKVASRGAWEFSQGQQASYSHAGSHQSEAVGVLEHDFLDLHSFSRSTHCFENFCEVQETMKCRKLQACSTILPVSVASPVPVAQTQKMRLASGLYKPAKHICYAPVNRRPFNR